MLILKRYVVQGELEFITLLLLSLEFCVYNCTIVPSSPSVFRRKQQTVEHKAHITVFQNMLDYLSCGP